MKILPLRILILLAATGSLLLSSCIEQSTVIKVKPDGSGIIHERNYSGASDDVISLPSLSGKKKAAEEEPKLPSEAALKQYASTLGAGVTFKSVKASINKKGWKGYEILYEFKDINTVRYARKTPKPESGDNEGDDKMKRNDDGFTATFAKVGGKLSIKVDRDSFGKTDQAAVQQPNSPTIDPYADTTAPSPAQMTLSSPVMNEVMMKAMTKGMRMGIFVQIDGEIANTNAAHRNGNLITLFNVDLGTMLKNKDGMAAMNQLENVDQATFQTLADQLDGLDIDLQNPIVVEIK